MKNLITTTLMAVFALAASVQLANAQDTQRATPAIQQRTQQSQQRLVVDPNPQSPQLGVTGRIIRNYGFRVDTVVRYSLAEEMGLERGDIILFAGEYQVDSSQKLRFALEDAQFSRTGNLVLIVDNVRARNGLGGQRFVRVKGRVAQVGTGTEVFSQSTRPRQTTRNNR